MFKRSSETRDIVRRTGVVSPSRISLRNLPIDHPASAFNPGAVLEDERAGDTLLVFPRVILGYYMYASSIACFKMPVQDAVRGLASNSKFSADVVVYPSNKHDIWGTEDPRVYRINGKLYMTYTGRAINYFETRRWKLRTRPVTAVLEGETWVKKTVFVTSDEKLGDVVSDKNAFLYDTGGENLLLFHRLHTVKDRFHLVISRVPRDSLEPLDPWPREVEVKECKEVLMPEKWEKKLGWGTPPVKIEANKYVVLIHAVDRDGVVYRVFAALMRIEGDNARVEAVTPTYIMEPHMEYEIVGDRPLVVFPCGAVRVDDNIIVTYGAADLFVGIGVIRLDELMMELDRGVVE